VETTGLDPARGAGRLARRAEPQRRR
jgi:hypothetical protein